MHPNILIVCTDQQFAGAMSCAGNADLRTPAMDRLAAAGTRFEGCYCAQPLCGPSRVAMFYGRMPHQLLEVPQNNVPVRPEFLPQGMGRLLSDAGYHCAYGGKWHAGGPGSLPAENAHGFERIAPMNDNLLAGACVEFLRRDHRKPWLLVASFDNPHNICEYARNEPLPWTTIPEPPIEQCPNVPANFAIPPHEPQLLRLATASDRRVWPTREYTLDQWRRLRNAYFRLCEFADGEIGRILDGLEATGFAENTVVIFTSDHGDGHGAHQWNQKWALYEEEARVPFLVVDPHAPAEQRGRVDSAHLVSNGLDLLPTVLEYAGVPGPGDLPGRSVRPLVHGERVGDWPEELVCQTDFGSLPRNSAGRMLRTHRYKYCVYGWGQDREQLFDLAADAGEMVNLAVEARHRDMLDEHRRRLRAWCRRYDDPFLRRVPAPAEEA